MNGPLISVGVAVGCFLLAIAADARGWSRVAQGCTVCGLGAMAATLVLAAVWS